MRMQSRLLGCSRSMPGSAAWYIARVRATSNASSSRTVRRRGARREVGPGDAEAVEVLLRQVDPAAAQVLGHVADEVRHLEGLAEIVRVSSACAVVDRLEDRHHLQADHRGRALHVGLEVGVRRVAGDVDVHPHAGQERDERSPAGCPRCAAVCTAARLTGSTTDLDRCAVEVVQELLAPRDGRSGSGVGRAVDVLVGLSREAVERVHEGSFRRRQQQGGEVVGAAVRRVEPTARLVRRVRSAGSVIPAASSSRSLTGTRLPAPRDPARGARPGRRRDRLRARVGRDRRLLARGPASTASVATSAAVDVAITGPTSRNRFEPWGAIIIDSQKLPPAATSTTRRSSRVQASRPSPHSTYQGWTTGPRNTTTSRASPAARSQPIRPARSQSQSSTTAVTAWPASRSAEITGSWYVTKFGTLRTTSMSMPMPVGIEVQATTWPEALSLVDPAEAEAGRRR